MIKSLHALWKFSRPHTIIGTHLQMLTSYVLVNGFSLAANLNMVNFTLFWLSSILMNIYVVGLNQIVDIDVDIINKPDLPLAANELSKKTGFFIVAFSGLVSLGLSYTLGGYFFWTVLGIIIIGSLYSLPPVHLKKNPIGAALGIATARGLIFNLGTFLFFNTLNGNSMVFPFQVEALAFFLFGFCLVIAVMKDIPDIVGDQQHNIKTLAVRLGPQKAFHISLLMLSTCYAVFIIGGLLQLLPHSNELFALIHFIILALIWILARQIKPENPQDIYAYYMKLWKFFYFEFIIFIFLFGFHR